MRKKKRLILVLLLFLIFSSYNPEKFRVQQSFYLSIKKIIIEETVAVDVNQLREELKFLIEKNILFLDKEEIKKVLGKYDFISNVKIKKIFPKTVKIIIVEEQPIGILHYDRKKFYISSNGKKIKYKEIYKYKNLPLVFGNQNNFYLFYKELQEINFPISKVKEFYFFEINRWDVVMNNNKILKLPVNSYKKIAKNFTTILNDVNFDKYQIFDYRIENQLILK